MDIPLLCVSDWFEADDYDEGDMKTPRGQAAPHAPKVGKEVGALGLLPGPWPPLRSGWRKDMIVTRR